jgi:hypothetical protein
MMSFPPETFSAYPQPERNTPETVSRALERVTLSRNIESSRLAYERLLGALGNGHAGVYHPVVLAVMPHLESILLSGEP